MKENVNLKIIAHIRSDYTSKFAIPRQSGLVDLKSEIIFTKQYRNDDALRGLEGFSHLWLLWEFSESKNDEWSPTVRPPRLGGNKKVGVFATRSPFRPNPIGLSSVKLEKIIRDTPDGTVLVVSGADLLDGTPIYDIKPYIAYTDSHPEALGGFSDGVFSKELKVNMPDKIKAVLPSDKIEPLCKILSQDPRPAYQNDENRIYAFEFSSFHIEFFVKNDILTVLSITTEK